MQTNLPFVYDPEALRKDLEAIDADDMDIPGMVCAVKATCARHGVEMVVSASEKEKRSGSGGRKTAATLKCKIGMPKRGGAGDNASGEHTYVAAQLSIRRPASGWGSYP